MCSFSIDLLKLNAVNVVVLQNKEEEGGEEARGGVSRAGYLFLMEKSEWALAIIPLRLPTAYCTPALFHNNCTVQY